MTSHDEAAILRARDLLADHREGRHAEADDPIDGCQWPGCEEAYWIVARVEEGTPPGERLAELLAELERELPPGARVVHVTSPLIRFGAS